MERCTSYGRGGAGNLRRMSEAKAIQESEPWTKEEAPKERRRSSIFSLSGSPSERRGSLWKSATNLFRKNSTVEETDKPEE